jgi:hypothetical protein
MAMIIKKNRLLLNIKLKSPCQFMIETLKISPKMYLYPGWKKCTLDDPLIECDLGCDPNKKFTRPLSKYQRGKINCWCNQFIGLCRKELWVIPGKTEE